MEKCSGTSLSTDSPSMCWLRTGVIARRADSHETTDPGFSLARCMKNYRLICPTALPVEPSMQHSSQQAVCTIALALLPEPTKFRQAQFNNICLWRRQSRGLALVPDITPNDFGGISCKCTLTNTTLMDVLARKYDLLLLPMTVTRLWAPLNVKLDSACSFACSPSGGRPHYCSDMLPQP